jgi:hypothetical protein
MGKRCGAEKGGGLVGGGVGGVVNGWRHVGERASKVV